MFADLILPIYSSKFYTYKVPASLENKIKVGQRVIVKVRNKLYTGIVAKLHNQQPEYQTKTIEDILDPQPLINQIHIQFWQWIAQYYMATIGEVYLTAVPPSLRLEGTQKIYPAVSSLKGIIFTPIEEQIFKLVSKKPLTISLLQAKIGVKNILPFIKSMLEKGIIRLDQTVENPFKPITEKFIKLSENINSQEKLNQTIETLSRAKKQLDLLINYLALSKFNFQTQPKEVSKKQLLEKVPSPSALKALLDKKIFIEYEKLVPRIKTDINQLKQINPLTEEQQKAFEQIQNLFKEKTTVLLFGVTGSGKTEIYIHLIKKYLEQGKQILYLLPEIAITTQIIYRLQAVFGDKVGVYHSKLNDAERAEVWLRLKGRLPNLTKYQIIVGVRSAIFLPFDNLGLIIIDEEHENTYKQYDSSPRYNARDAAIMLATMTGAKVLLGTATPAIETFYNAKTGKYGLVTLTKRYENILLPKIILLNTREAAKKNLMKSIFHQTLLNAIKQALQNNKQVILFRNRRGFAPYLECQDCGWIPKCKHCDVSLTYHKEQNKLICHYCGYTIDLPPVCPKCGSFKLKLKSFGTERIEDELQIFFPSAKIARLDLDTTRSKYAYQDIIERFQNNEIQILVGTQMITKGLDFENVAIVGILNADNILNFPDFRAYERAFQLMVQVSGRAGRKGQQGTVYIQTSNPNHPIFEYIINNDYTSFFNWQIRERKLFKYPPFVRLIKIIVKDKDKQKVDILSEKIAQQLRQTLKHRVLGPEYPLISKIQNWYRKEILIKLEHKLNLQKIKDFIMQKTNEIKLAQNYTKVIVIFDVDPM